MKWCVDEDHTPLEYIPSRASSNGDDIGNDRDLPQLLYWTVSISAICCQTLDFDYTASCHALRCIATRLVDPLTLIFWHRIELIIHSVYIYRLCCHRACHEELRLRH